MDVCDRWLVDDFFHRHGWTLTFTPDGRRTAVAPHGYRLVLDPPCGHDPDLCPPHVPAVRKIGAAA
jgi:hypothetical protein